MQRAQNRFLALLLMLLSTAVVQAQTSEDFSLIEERAEKHRHGEDYRPTYLFQGRSAVAKYNPVSLFFGGLMLGYQKYISPQISAECLYEESCSKFGVSLIREYGLLKGAPLSIDRVSRCNRLSAIDTPLHIINPNTGKTRDSLANYRLSRKKK